MSLYKHILSRHHSDHNIEPIPRPSLNKTTSETPSVDGKGVKDLNHATNELQAAADQQNTNVQSRQKQYSNVADSSIEAVAEDLDISSLDISIHSVFHLVIWIHYRNTKK